MKGIRGWQYGVVATASAVVVGLAGVLLFVRFDAPHGPEPIGPEPAAAVRSGSATTGDAGSAANGINGKGIPTEPGPEYTYSPPPGQTAPPTGRPTSANISGPIVNVGSGLCLQPAPNPPQSIYDNGVRIAQRPCNGTAAQLWRPILLGQGRNPLYCSGFGCPDRPTESYYYVTNYLTGLCMDVKNASTLDGVIIQQYKCNGGGSEKWFKHLYVYSGRFQYVNARTAKCLDIPHATTGPSNVWQYRCTDINNPGYNLAQAFTFPG